HIENLVALITTNAGNAWEEAAHLAVEQDELTLAGLEDALALAEQGVGASSVADAVNAAIERAGGDVAVALEAALFQLTRPGIAAQIEAEFGEALAAAEAEDDAAAIASLEEEVAVREAALLQEAIGDALNASDGDAEVALIRAQHGLADNALQNARDSLDTAVSKFEAGRPIQDAPTPLELTRGTCGQR
ncbi:MAG: hypothetical protein OXI03_07425, partial [Chloroflexota bacterium]|nr:hypothetical protein [Chloroflexota bacterium]